MTFGLEQHVPVELEKTAVTDRGPRQVQRPEVVPDLVLVVDDHRHAPMRHRLAQHLLAVSGHHHHVAAPKPDLGETIEGAKQERHAPDLDERFGPLGGAIRRDPMPAARMTAFMWASSHHEPGARSSSRGTHLTRSNTTGPPPVGAAPDAEHESQEKRVAPDQRVDDRGGPAHPRGDRRAVRLVPPAKCKRIAGAAVANRQLGVDDPVVHEERAGGAGPEPEPSGWANRMAEA